MKRAARNPPRRLDRTTICAWVASAQGLDEGVNDEIGKASAV